MCDAGTARLGDGVVLRGIAKGLDVDGALLLGMDDGEFISVAAGDVFLWSA